MLSPDGLKGAQSARRLNVADKADADKGRRLENSNSLHDLLFVDLGAGSVHLANDVGHAGLVGEEAGQVDGFGGIVPGEGLHFAAVAAGALLGKEAFAAVARRFEFPMRLKERR